MVNVWPRDDTIRKLLKHPSGVGFNSDAAFDPAVWPDDQFTTRRLQEGAVTSTAAPKPPSAPAPAEKRRSSRSTEGD